METFVYEEYGLNIASINSMKTLIFSLFLTSSMSCAFASKSNVNTVTENEANTMAEGKLKTETKRHKKVIKKVIKNEEKAERKITKNKGSLSSQLKKNCDKNNEKHCLEQKTLDNKLVCLKNLYDLDGPDPHRAFQNNQCAPTPERVPKRGCGRFPCAGPCCSVG